MEKADEKNKQQIIDIIDYNPTEEVIDIDLVQQLPFETVEMETPDAEGNLLEFTKYRLIENSLPDSEKIMKTSQIHLQLVMRHPNGKIHKEVNSQPNQKRKYKLLSPKFKELFEFLRVTIFSMKVNEVAFIKVPKEVHRFSTFDHDLFWRVEIPFEKLTKGVNGQGKGTVGGKTKVNIEEIKGIIQGAEALKSEGNQSYKNGRIHDALEKWMRAKDDLRCIPKVSIEALDPASQANLNKVKIDLVNNILLVHKANLDFGQAAIIFAQSKKFSATNPKFIKRYASILVKRGDQDKEAMELIDLFTEAWKGEKDSNFDSIVKDLKKFIASEIKDEKKRIAKERTKGFQNFFGNVSKKMEDEEKIRLRKLKKAKQ